MRNHDFGELKTDQVSNEKYRKCKLCDRVMFENGDPYFNMVCFENTKAREELRQRLEKS